MEGFKLDVSAVVSEHVHHQLQVLCPTDVLGHDSEVVSVQEKFAEKLRNRATCEPTQHVSYTSM